MFTLLGVQHEVFNSAKKYLESISYRAQKHTDFQLQRADPRILHRQTIAVFCTTWNL